MTKLTHDEMIQAITDGVKEAFLEVLTIDGMLSCVTAKDICDSLRQGVSEAVWRVATNASDMPSSDFYESIKEGTAAGIARVSE